MSLPRVLNFFAMEKKRSYVLSSSCLAVITFFYFFVVRSALEIRVYTLLHRVSYDHAFMLHITTLNIDAFILLSATIAWLFLSVKERRIEALLVIYFSSFLLLDRSWMAVHYLMQGRDRHSHLFTV